MHFSGTAHPRNEWPYTLVLKEAPLVSVLIQLMAQRASEFRLLANQMTISIIMTTHWNGRLMLSYNSASSTGE